MTAPAWADSDGRYCIGPDYIAYQFGLAPTVTSHRIYVIRLGGAQGIGDPRVLELPQFQVHGRVCAEATMRMQAFDSVYIVKMNSSRRPGRREKFPGDRRAEMFGMSHEKQLGGFRFRVGTLEVRNTLVLKDPYSGHAAAGTEQLGQTDSTPDSVSRYCVPCGPALPGGIAIYRLLR